MNQKEIEKQIGLFQKNKSGERKKIKEESKKKTDYCGSSIEQKQKSGKTRLEKLSKKQAGK